MNIEAEGGEITLKNENEDIAIIPKIHRSKVLNWIKEGNYKAIDELVGTLPTMEDYAEDGSLVYGDEDGAGVGAGIGTTTTKATKETTTLQQPTSYIPKGVYNEEEFDKLAKEYENPKKYAKFGQPRFDNPSETWGCLGGSCTNLKTTYPGFKSHYELFEKANVYSGKKGKAPITQGYPITAKTPEEIKKKASANTAGVDSWEYPYIIQDYGLGKMLFNYDIGKENVLLKSGDESMTKKRLSYLENLDQTEIPLGAVLSFGDAREAGYVAPDAKSYRGKDEPLYRHSIVKIGNVEGVDAEGNPTVDVIYDDLGKILRIGNSTKANKNWNTFIDQLGAITTRNDLGDWSYKKLKGDKYVAPKKNIKPVVSVMKEIGQMRQDIENSIAFEEEAGLISKQEAETKRKSIPTDPEKVKELLESIENIHKVPE